MPSLLLLLALALLAPTPDPGDAPTLELPPSPAADYLAQAADETAPLERLPRVPDWSSRAWLGAEPWQAWSAALEAPDEPDARLYLTLNARALDRSEATWLHFQRLPRTWAEGLFVELLLAPRKSPSGETVLRPLLPPVPVVDPKTWSGLPPKRIYSASGLLLDQTQLSLSVEVAPEGVEVHLSWQAGPPLDTRVRILTPDDWRARLVYVDWDRTEPEPEGLALRLSRPGADQDPEHTLWARCEAERRTWPRLGEARYTSSETPVALVTTADDPQLPRLRQAATFLTRSLGLAVEVRTTLAPAPSTGRTPLSIDLSPGPRRDLELRDLLTQAERVALARRVVESPEAR